MKSLKVICSIAFLILLQCSVSAQRNTKKTPPSTPSVKASDIPSRKRAVIPEDEILFSDFDYLKLPGWRLATKGAGDPEKGQDHVYYDAYRITNTTKGTKRVWIKYLEVKDGSYVMALEEFDCQEERSRTLQATDYNKDGKVYKTEVTDNEWSYLSPDSVGDVLAGILCRNEVDWEERSMREAAERFQLARRFEKIESLTKAMYWYEKALEFAPNNAKILAGIARLRKVNVPMDQPPPPPWPKKQ